ncbi:MAG TPA: hypothetical protein VFM25_04945 [Verrucomicrobiae bacterium]|nr:hypothetical protein [Verrucomicrobiae bacterium]
MKKLLLSAIFAVSAFIFTHVFGFLGEALAGAGHGSAILGNLFLSPVYEIKSGAFIAFGPCIWGIVAAFLPWTRNWYASLSIVILLFIAYCGAAWDIAVDVKETGTISFAYELFEKIPEIAIPLVVVYGLMQAIVYWRIISTKPLNSLKEKN